MSEHDNDDEIEIVNEGSIPNYVVAEGASEFKADPADFMNLIGGASNQSFMQELNQRSSSGQTHKQIDVGVVDRTGNPDVMADILRKFNSSAEQMIDNQLRNPSTGPELQKTLIKESTKDDTWKIQLNEGVKTGKYRVVNGLSQKCFFEGVSLMESAKKICDCLENHQAVNSPKIQKILYYDKIYENSYSECQNFKRLHAKYKSEGNNVKMNIMADKFETSKEKALSAKKAIKSL